MCIYIIPPTKDRLISQMGNRGIERLERSKKQLGKVKDIYDWLIVNDDLEIAVEEIENLSNIIRKYAHNFDNADIDTMNFLYQRNFHNKKNLDFLNNFYNTKEEKDMEL